LVKIGKTVFHLLSLVLWTDCDSLIIDPFSLTVSHHSLYILSANLYANIKSLRIYGECTAKTYSVAVAVATVRKLEVASKAQPAKNALSEL
jgi:hypothetical protein